MARTSNFAAPAKASSATDMLPAPTGGLNARDNLASMQPNQAVRMTNLFPKQYGVQLRRGWEQWATGISGDVETLIHYANADGSEKLFGIASGNLYDVTAPGPVGAPINGTPYANSRWQQVQMNNQFGNFTVMVNGADVPKKYNGTAWTDAVYTDTGEPTFDPTKLINVTLSHRRLWFVEKDSTRAYYADIDAVEGPVTLFDVGEVFPNGGYLQAIGTWSVRAGISMNEQTVFVSSQGDVAVFEGFDPDTAPDTWSLVGIYKIGATLSRRCLTKFGSDLLVLCEDGLLPLSNVLSQSGGEIVVALSDIIQQALSDDVNTYRDEFGWESVVINRYQQVYTNVPRPDDQFQYVMNQVTKAWCQFIGYRAFCWATHKQEAFFGADGMIGHAWFGALDNLNADGVGTEVQGECLQAFNDFGAPAIQKRWPMIRPVFVANDVPKVIVGLNVDYQTFDTLPQLSLVSGTLSLPEWDVALWDVDTWTGENLTVDRWYNANAIGFCAAPALKVSSPDYLVWVASHIVAEKGATL